MKVPWDRQKLGSGGRVKHREGVCLYAVEHKLMQIGDDYLPGEAVRIGRSGGRLFKSRVASGSRGATLSTESRS